MALIFKSQTNQPCAGDAGIDGSASAPVRRAFRPTMQSPVAGNSPTPPAGFRRKDLVVYVEGDLSQLKTGRKKPFVSIRQPVKVIRPDGSTFGELVGADATLEAVEGGGRAIFRGLAVDLRKDAPKQTVRVSLGYDSAMRQTVDINSDGGTVVKFDFTSQIGTFSNVKKS